MHTVKDLNEERKSDTNQSTNYLFLDIFLFLKSFMFLTNKWLNEK